MTCWLIVLRRLKQLLSPFFATTNQMILPHEQSMPGQHAKGRHEELSLMHSPDLNVWQRDTWQSRAASKKLPVVCEHRPFPNKSICAQRLVPDRDKEVKQQEHHVIRF